MTDIKLDQKNEKVAGLNERPLFEGEKLKQSLERFADAEKEKISEQTEKTAKDEIARTESQPPPDVTGQAAGIMAPEAKRQKQIESILAEDLAEIYLSLTPEKQQEFKVKGEQTANKINQLLAKAKINIGEIIKLIKKWLSLIPGINKYFLEQEAKIKADELVKLKIENK
ncbi:hypothetical protein HY797_03570 [Candidatus Falkowbacteria bacterium]|nr:hypothetical protein [Candidatus Falkowbacteria bacterium]